MSNIHKNFNSRTREGATKKQLGGRIGLLVSIHAPVWVRLIIMSIYDDHAKFQFTHPCGCDAKVKPTNKSVESFNSRTRVGATQISRKNNTMKEFQFTHPCGCDFHFVHHYGVDSCFNSRTRVGATVSNRTARLIPQVSIHAPVWVRLYCVGKMKALHRFQFTHPCGCDRVFRERAVQYYGFNSRTRVGATRLNCRTSKGNRFQFTHPCGCD